jgi:hypothetical protein
MNKELLDVEKTILDMCASNELGLLYEEKNQILEEMGKK